MPCLLSSELWKKSGRWQAGGEVFLFQLILDVQIERQKRQRIPARADS
jgi:hypothetical protein